MDHPAYRKYVLLAPQSTEPSTDPENNNDCGINAVWLSDSTPRRLFLGQNSLGNVEGPATSTDEAVVVFDGTSGKVTKAAPLTISPDGVIKYGLYNLVNFNPNLYSLFVGLAGGFNAPGTGLANVAIGVSSQLELTTGTFNTSVGYRSGTRITSATATTSCGSHCLDKVTSGDYNSGFGSGAGFALTTGNHNLLLGANAGLFYTTESYNICILASGLPGDQGVLRVGDLTNTNRAFVHGIRGVITGNADAIPVVIDSAGQLGTVSSSIKYKENVKDLPAEVSEKMYQLRPVQFNYKSQPEVLSLGLIAEEVERVDPSLCIYEDLEKKTLLTVDYAKLVPIMLAELQKLKAKVDSLSIT